MAHHHVRNIFKEHKLIGRAYLNLAAHNYAGQEPPAEAEPKFNPFTGTGRRLDGKPLKTTQPPPVSSSATQDRRSNVSGGGTATASSSSSQSSKNQTQGKLVFGSNANRSKDEPKVCFHSLT